MTLEFCFLLNVILLSRLSFTFVDNPISRGRAAVLSERIADAHRRCDPNL